MAIHKFARNFLILLVIDTTLVSFSPNSYGLKTSGKQKASKSASVETSYENSFEEASTLRKNSFPTDALEESQGGILRLRILHMQEKFGYNSDGKVLVESTQPSVSVVLGRDIPDTGDIVLECVASFPVQWSYVSAGSTEKKQQRLQPTFTKRKMRLFPQKPTQFRPGLYVGEAFTAYHLLRNRDKSLKPQDSGEYTCSGGVFSAGSQIRDGSFFIQIPGKMVFTMKQGHRLEVPQNNESIVVPCSVTNPQSQVSISIHRQTEHKVQCSASIGANFHPTRGFELSSDDIVKSNIKAGDAFVCVATLHDSFEVLAFPLTPPIGRNFQGDSAEETSPFDYEDDSLELYDLPQLRNDHNNPCHPQNPCGPNSICKTYPWTNRPRCACIRGYIGHPPNCRPECVLHIDCPSNTTCDNYQCVDPCEDACGHNAICSIRRHMAICSCPPGYSGNPKKNGKCGKTRSPSQHYFPSRPGYFERTTQSSAPLVQQPTIWSKAPSTTNERNPCFPWPCGQHSCVCRSDCTPRGNKAHCSCSHPYVGVPPNCRRPECRGRNDDCPQDSVCRHGFCQDPCATGEFQCGKGAKCMTISHTPRCFCPAGYRGDPFVRCRPRPAAIGGDQELQQVSANRPGSRPSFPESSPLSPPLPNFPPHQSSNSANEMFEHAKPQHVSSTSPCFNSPCGTNAICSFRNETVGCKCPQGFSGPGSDPYTICFKSTEVHDPCDKCGPNSECVVKGSRSNVTCFCLPGRIGRPPNCGLGDCKANSDCMDNEHCFGNECQDVCLRAQCGPYAECKGRKHVAVCACRNAPDKDPLFNCQ